MKITKKVLSLFLTVLMLLSMSVLTMAEAITHEIDSADETTFSAAEYTSTKTTYTKGGKEYTVSDAVSVVDDRLELTKSFMDGTTERNYTTTVTYTMNFAKSGYYRFRLTGMYKTAAPTVYISVDGGEEITASAKLADEDSTTLISHVAVSAGAHSVTFKFTAGGASLKTVIVRNMQQDIGTGITQIPIVNYISTSNSGGIRDYSSNGVRYCIPVISSETANLGAGGGLNNKYKINVLEAGQYRLSAWSGRTQKNIYADVSVVGSDGFTILARGIGTPGEGITKAGGVATSSFNLSEGVQTLHLRFHAVNDDPINKTNNTLYLYYIELEKVDSVQNAVEISETEKNEIEPEMAFYTDDGITKTADSAIISAGKTACFYADIPTDGKYAVSFKYKSNGETNVKVNNLTKNIYKDALIPTNDEFLTYTLSVSDLKSGENRITITPDKDLEIEKIYIKKISDETVLSTINAAETEEALKSAISTTESSLDIELTDATNGIFYDKPVYNRLIKRDYSSIDDFIAEYNKALIAEYDNPWITLYIDDVKKLELESGDIKLTASTGYLPKGSLMIVALYENLENGIKTLHNFAICEEVSENTYDFLFGETEIKPESSYTLEFFYWDGMEKVSPIEVFNAVYEEIYVSASGKAETADGTEENPYPTIQAALEKVKQINDYQWGDIIVNVKGGTYTLTETLTINEDYSGKNGYNVIIRGENNSQPIISGGIKITDWEIDSGNIWKAPLSGVDYVRNLYVNGYPAVIARSDRHYDTAVINDTSVPTTVHRVNTEGGTNLYDIPLKQSATGLDSAVVKGWSGNAYTLSKEDIGLEFENAVGLEFVWPYTFESHITPVTSYSKNGENMTFSMNADLLERRATSAFAEGSAFYLQNAKELINKPGEFYYDKSAGYIYYYPYSYENIQTADVYVGNVEGMVKVSGSSNTSKVSNITFENLSFRYGAYNFISKYGYIGSQTDGILQPFSWSEGQIAYKAQFAVDNADNINIKGCEFACLGSAGISMIDSVSNSKIEGNIIRDISGTGIRIGHPIHNRQRDGVEVCQYIDITNNVIRRIANQMFNNCAITVYYEKFINILHNDIENVPYSGMSIGWGWGGGSSYDCSDIDVSYNRIQNVMNTLSDGGGVYTLGPLKNSKISNNYIADHNAGHGGLIYNDQGSSLIEVYNNVAIDGYMTHMITMANDLSSTTKKLNIHDNYSDVGNHSAIADGKEIYFEEYTKVTGKGENLSNPEALSIYRNSGLEENYKTLLAKPGVDLPVAGRTLGFDIPDPALKDETDVYATNYDIDNSSANLEIVEHPNGTGVVINADQYINYKLDIPESGYYRIMLYARNVGSGSNNIIVGGDAADVTMHINDGRKIDSSTADKNYRVCTAYFEKGVNDLRFSLQNATTGVIIKKVQYCPLEQTIEPDKPNLIKLKNYHTYSGNKTNTIENNQNGYSSLGCGKLVVGCITTLAGKTTTMTYDIYAEEAGMYKIDAAAWLMNQAEYTVTVGSNTISATSKQYSGSLHKTDITTIGEIYLPQGESTLTFSCTMPSGSGNSAHAYMFFLTVEKQN